MLAGDVMADFAGGVLTITGDGSGNGVELIPGDNPGEYRVIGTDVNGAMTQVTGTGVFIDDPMSDVVVDLGGGSDTFTIRGLSAATPLAVHGGVSISDPSGANTFEVINARISGAFAVSGGVDEDDVQVDGSRIIGITSLALGDGDNSAMLFNNTVLDGDFIYSGGAAEDSVFVVEAEIDGIVSIATGDGNDKVVFGMSTDPTVGGDISISLGPGNDRAIIHDTDARRRVTIDGGDGHNIVDIEQSAIGVSVTGTVLDIANGTGHDTLSIRDTVISDDVIVANGGGMFGSDTDIVDSDIRGDFDFFADDGVDIFNVANSQIRNDVSLTFGDGESFVSFLGADLGDDLAILGGMHRDDVTLESTVLEGDADISLLAGIDRLSVLAGTQLKGISTLSGGAGIDVDVFTRELAPGAVDIALLLLTEFEDHQFVNN